MTNGATAAAAAQQAIANAIKASGVLIEVTPDDFTAIVNRNSEPPLVVYAPAGFFAKHKYLTAYKGLCFYTKTDTPLVLASDVEVVVANKIWIPG